jgi:predicted GNAT family acetyltransferase
MSTGETSDRFEYPDSAGYPDGAGFLDEGTVQLVDEVTADAVRAVDRPSADAESEVEVHRRDDEHAYVAVIDGVDVANIRYDEVDGRIVVLTTTVEPEFRGRGIATNLIADALDDLRARRMPLTVRCPVVTAFIASNAQYADLLDPGHRGQ